MGNKTKWEKDFKIHSQKVADLTKRQMNEGETFLGNQRLADMERIKQKVAALKTLRIGKQSYDITGGKLNRRKYRPLFLDISESAAYEKFMRSY